MAASIQDRAHQYINQLDNQLRKYPALIEFQQRTSVPAVYVVLGVGALYFFLIFFNIGSQFLVNAAAFVLPAYYSLDALFSASKSDDTQWLTYWVVYAFLTVIESAISASYWFPFYYTFKFILILWMALPATNGARILFHTFLRPMFARYFQSKPAHVASNLRAQAEKIL